MRIDRVFTELTPEVDYTAQMYAQGKEKKEIAAEKFRALCTINNQLMKAFEVLDVRNRSELSLIYAKRIAIAKARVFITKAREHSNEIGKSIVSIFLLGVFCYGVYHETSNYYRRSERIEIYARRRVRKPDDALDLKPLLI